MVEVYAGWDGEHLIPIKRSQKTCDAQLVVGERYILEVGMPQSASKRAMFHASLADIFLSLPDETAERFLNKDHFRYWLTIKCGFADEMTEVCETKAEAERQKIRTLRLAPYSVVEQKDNVLKIWTARSTKAGAMDGREFSALVDAVLAKAADLIGVDRKALDDMNRTRRERPDKQIAELAAQGSGVAELEHAAKPEGSARPDPSGRRLTYDEATVMVPMAIKIGAAVIRPDGGLSKSEWTLDEVLYDLKNAEVIALSDKAPGFPLGMQDRNGRVVYFATRPRADG